MTHHTKHKGDIGVAKTIADLTTKGYTLFAPIISEHLRFDLVAFKNNTFFKIQCKYSSTGTVPYRTSWSRKNGFCDREYKSEDLDYFAIYLPQIDRVLYPNFSFAGIKIRTTVPNSPIPFYWWEDFTDLTDKADKRTYTEFNKKLTRPSTNKVNILPSKEELQNLLWEKPKTKIAEQYGVSDSAVEKWCKKYEVEKPPRGYWLKSK